MTTGSVSPLKGRVMTTELAIILMYLAIGTFVGLAFMVYRWAARDPFSVADMTGYFLGLLSLWILIVPCFLIFLLVERLLNALWFQKLCIRMHSFWNKSHCRKPLPKLEEEKP